MARDNLFNLLKPLLVMSPAEVRVTSATQASRFNRLRRSGWTGRLRPKGITYGMQGWPFSGKFFGNVNDRYWGALLSCPAARLNVSLRKLVPQKRTFRNPPSARTRFAGLALKWMERYIDQL